MVIRLLEGKQSGDIVFYMYVEDDVDIELAKKYCRDNDLTPENVTIKLKKDEQNNKIVVVTMK